MIILVVLLIAIFKGYKRGLAVEVLGFASIFIAGFAAFYLTTPIGDFIKSDFSYKHEVVFVAIFLAAVFGVSLIAKLISNFFVAIGLGLANHIGGAAISFLKYVIILSSCLSLFVSINKNFNIVSQKKMEETIFYEPMSKLAEKIFPYYKEAKKGFNSIKKEYFD